MSGVTLSGSYSSFVSLSSSTPTVTVSGTIDAYGTAGIYTISLNGALTPITASSALFGPAGTDFTLDNSGVIIGAGSSSNWFDAGAAFGSSAYVINTGTIAGSAGLFVFGSSTSAIENKGLIDGSVSAGIFLGSPVELYNSGTIEGVKAGVIVQNTGASYIGNFSGAVISASAGYAAQIEGGLIVNNGLLTGAEGGANINYWGTLTNTGTILGTATTPGTANGYAAINANLYGTAQSALISNTGKIEGQYGVRVGESGTGGNGPATLVSTISNAGTIIGTLGAGVANWAGTALVQNTGTIIATGTSIATNGTMTLGSGGVDIGQNGTVYNYAGADISGLTGVRLGTGTVLNAGTITGTGFTNSAYSGVYDQFGGAVFNTVSGTISGVFGVRFEGGSNDFVYNAGSIGATQNVGVYFLGTGTVVNHGDITGAHRGVQDEGINGNIGGVVANYGLLEGTGTTWVSNGVTKTSSGISMLASGSIANAASASIVGGNGIYISASSGAAVTVSNAGYIFGDLKNGVVAVTALDLANSGTINAAGGNAVSATFASTIVNSGLIENANTHAAVYGFNGLSLSNAAHGTIVSGGNAVYVHGGPATIQNAGLIQSLSTIVTRAGVQLESGGFVSNTGTIEDLNASGVMLNSGISTLDNSGLIAGRNLGVIASGATANVANYGVIEASGTASFADFGLTAAMPAGIELRNGGTIYNAAKADVSGVYGVYLAPSSGTFTLTNAGTITGTSKAGICMPSGSGGTIINEAGATIVGASGAYITATSATTVFNAGVIAGTVNSGLIFHGAAYVQNSGTITGTAHNAMSADAAHGTLVNEAGGYLKGLRALFTSYSAYLTNFGTMIGTSYGVWANQAATVTNAGQITGVYGGIDGFGGIITNAVGGTISGTGGAGNGVDIRGGVGTVVNAGLIKGFGTAATNGGVLLNGGGTVNNSGTILNLSGTGVMVFNGVATVENSGTIAGLDMGVIALGGTAAAALATVANYGVIQATGFTDFSDFGVTTNIPTAIELKNGGTLLNGAPGSITGQTGVYAQGNAVVTNAGLIQGVSFGVDANGTGATLANSGVISASNGIGVNLLGGGTLTDSGTISGTTDAVSFGSGFSELVLVPGAELLGSVAATSLGGLVLASAASAGSFDMGGSVTGFSQITFETGAQWTLGGTTAELTGNGTNIINGFAAGDTLIVEGFTATSNTFVSILGTDNDTLLLSNGLTALNVNFTGAFGLNPFIVTDVAAGTQITLCYLQGTRILTPTGERCVEDLAIGDLVVTRQGGFAPITWIGRQSYAGAFLAHNPDKAPVCVKAGALAQTMPRRDLWLSPGHAVFVEGALVLAKALVNGVTVTQDEAPETVEYYAIELDGHDCLFAEGAWAESYADGPGLRAQFHNLDDHRARFPGYVEPETIALCAPRPEAGPALAAALAPVVARAAALVQPGALRGVVDLIEADGLVEGWAQDAANPDLPVALEICLGETVLGRVLACDYREDLAAAGIGHGRAKFSFTVPGGLDDATRAGVVVRRGSDGAALPYSEELVRRVA